MQYGHLGVAGHPVPRFVNREQNSATDNVPAVGPKDVMVVVYQEEPHNMEGKEIVVETVGSGSTVTHINVMVSFPDFLLVVLATVKYCTSYVNGVGCN